MRWASSKIVTGLRWRGMRQQRDYRGLGDPWGLVKNLLEALKRHESYLVGGLEHVLFFHILGIVTPIDFHIVQRG